MTKTEVKKDLDTAVKETREFQENLNKAAEQTQDVKDGRCTAEDEKNEPAFKLYNSIAESTVKIIQNDVVQAGLLVIGQQLGEDVLRALVQILTVSMTYSAHEAIVFYDDLLKVELQKQFDHMGESVNSAGAILQAHAGVIQVLQERIQALENINHTKAAGG